MGKYRVSLAIGLLLVLAVTGWYLRGVFQNTAGGKDSASGESRKNSRDAADRELKSRQPTANSHQGAFSGAAGGRVSPSAPPAALPEGLQPSEASPDQTTIQLSGESVPKNPPSPKTSPSPPIEVVDVKVSPDGSTSYVVRLLSATGKPGSRPLLMLPPNVRPEDVELTSDGRILGLKQPLPAERLAAPSSKK